MYIYILYNRWIDRICHLALPLAPLEFVKAPKRGRQEEEHRGEMRKGLTESTEECKVFAVALHCIMCSLACVHEIFAEECDLHVGEWCDEHDPLFAAAAEAKAAAREVAQAGVG